MAYQFKTYWVPKGCRREEVQGIKYKQICIEGAVPTKCFLPAENARWFFENAQYFGGAFFKLRCFARIWNISASNVLQIPYFADSVVINKY